MKIMMVCLGNICRSPLAEGILRSKIEQRGLDWVVASSGTSSYHIGQHPDGRSIVIGQQNGVDISALRARQFRPEDLAKYDFILAMDTDNYEDILSMCSSQRERDKVQLIMDYGNDPGIQNVPDPYYGGPGGFARVYEMLDEATEQLIQHMLLNQR